MEMEIPVVSYIYRAVPAVLVFIAKTPLPRSDLYSPA